MSSDIVFSSAAEQATLVRSRELSPVEIMKAHLERIEAVEPKLNAIVTLAGERSKLPKWQKRPFYGETR